MKRKLRGCLLAVLGIAIMLVIGTWLVLTQPIAARSRPEGVPPRMPTVDATRLQSHVRTLSERFHPRDWRHPQNLDRVAAYIGEEFRRAGGRASEQVYSVQGREYRNVIARFGPESGERIVVGAHYDTAGEQPGADDNASAVAGLIELAHLLGRAGRAEDAAWPGKAALTEPTAVAGRTAPPVGAEYAAPRLAVELVAYTLEEPPFFGTLQMGSAVHARALRDQSVPVRVMICLEMIGYFRDEPGSQSYPLSLLKLFYPARGDYIAVVGKLGEGGVVRRVKAAMRVASPLPVRSINAPAIVPGLDFSDHLNYWNAGYKAVMITDTAFYRNRHYHDIGDTWDTLDYERMAMVVQGVYAAVLAYGS
jgi:Zn-dependent M28 family amino/carboxypeptidase